MARSISEAAPTPRATGISKDLWGAGIDPRRYPPHMWQLKALAQGALARIPGGLRLKNAVGHRLRKARPVDAQVESMLRNYERPLRVLLDSGVQGLDVVEVGTGWMPVVPLLLSLGGARSIYTCDHLRHIAWPQWTQVVAALRATSGTWRTWPGLGTGGALDRLSAIEAATNLDEGLAAAALRYDAPADATRLPQGPQSADLHFSYSVVENMPVPVFIGSLAEARRVLRPGGRLSFVAGCSDPCRTFDASLSRVHYLRYEDWYWNALTSNPFSYNNRLRAPEFVQYVEAAGFRVERIHRHIHRPDIARLGDLRLPARFARFPPEELAIHKVEIHAQLASPGGTPLVETTWVDTP